jgi:ATP-binding cassette subfamily B (MDR/TAP) protein 1
VNTLVSTSYGAIINGLGAFACGVVLALIATWRLALVSLSVSPLIILAGIVESQIHQNSSTEEKADSNESKSFQEVSTNMRTVGSLNAQTTLIKRFDRFVITDNNSSIGKVAIASSMYGLGQFAMFAVYALTFYAGSEFTIKYDLSFKNLFRALFAIIFAAFGAGMSQQFAGNVGVAQAAAKKIFDYFEIHNTMVLPSPGVTTPIKGTIEFINVTFTYPQRKQPCFKGLSFKIEPMQKVAFAGPSGGGKSTIFSLLYRFYDPQEGQIMVDGVDIREYNIDHLRNSLGMVGQEPVLFNSTIKYNIKYNHPEFSDEAMVEAATTANAIKFIENDQAEADQKIQTQETSAGDDDGRGFERKVGLKGSKLSGGQKQRVAIARTVIRKPQVYMFDESTSALDTESEKVVQEALNKISAENTSMTIAHRISTIRDCDVIFVIENGSVVEQGKFQELMQKKGAFYQLNKEK